MKAIKVKALDLLTDGVVWFAALSTLNAAAMLVAEIVGH